MSKEFQYGNYEEEVLGGLQFTQIRDVKNPGKDMVAFEIEPIPQSPPAAKLMQLFNTFQGDYCGRARFECKACSGTRRKKHMGHGLILFKPGNLADLFYDDGLALKAFMECVESLREDETSLLQACGGQVQ